MNDQLTEMSCEIELQPGEKLELPSSLANSVGPGRWVLTIRPAAKGATLRDHRAFLNGYAPEDEGLYDADPTR